MTLAVGVGWTPVEGREAIASEDIVEEAVMRRVAVARQSSRRALWRVNWARWTVNDESEAVFYALCLVVDSLMFEKANQVQA